MPSHLPRLRWALIGSCAALLTFSAAAAAANREGVDLRVVAGERTLADQRQYTGQTKVPTSPSAECFGEGTGGSGEKVRLPGANALGILKHAQRTAKALRPLSLTDAFDFGLGLCAIGGIEPSPTGYWYLKRNKVGSAAGGDATPVENGDEILWYLIEDFNDPLPAELEIKAPNRAKGGATVTVEVIEHADDGSAAPAPGVRLEGGDANPSAAAVTDGNGEARIELTGRRTRLRAVREGAIPSAEHVICHAAGCPPGSLTRHIGTNRRDLITAIRGRSTVNALAGPDRIDVRAATGSPPTVRCGRGRDLVIAARGQRLDLKPGCEAVRRR